MGEIAFFSNKNSERKKKKERKKGKEGGDGQWKKRYRRDSSREFRGSIGTTI